MPILHNLFFGRDILLGDIYSSEHILRENATSIIEMEYSESEQQEQGGGERVCRLQTPAYDVNGNYVAGHKPIWRSR
jgi:hypothetical protein